MKKNKLIAEFMYPDWKHPKNVKTVEDDHLKSVGGDWFTLAMLLTEDYERLAYHDSWNSLMPVCRKLDFLVEDGFMLSSPEYVKRCEGLDDAVTRSYDIKQAYAVVVEFIKWYNDNKK